MKWLALAMLAVGCRDAFDPSKPIDVITSGTWTDTQRADLDRAAACWNIGFGVDYETSSTGDEQQVTVEFDELMCLNTQDWAWTAMGFETKVTICPDHFVGYDARNLFGVLAHELGHVAGIPKEVDDPYSIMGGIEPQAIFAGLEIFSPEDHALFSSYNPSFVQQPTCDPIVGFASDPQGFTCVCPAP